MKKLIQELKRRNVIRATIAYLIVAWALLEVAALLLPIMDAPEWILKITPTILAIGLPIWIVVSWIYDISPEGELVVTAKKTENQLKREITNKRLNIFIIISLVIAVVVLALRPSAFTKIKDHELSIAILPFEDIYVDEDKIWYSKGIVTYIHNYLSHIKDIHIISEQSVRKYKNTKMTIPEIASELDVSYIVSGSLRQLGDRIVVSASLIEASIDKQISMKNHDMELEDPWTTQMQISQNIVEQLKMELSPEEKEILERKGTENLQAFEFFTKGKILASTRSTENSVKDQSIEYYRKAIELDSNYAEAYAEMALMKWLSSGNIEEVEYLNKKALEINPNIARVYSTRALIQTQSNDLVEAKRNFEHALKINPNDATTHQHFALYYNYLEPPNHQNRLKHIKKAQKLEPHTNTINNGLIYSLLVNERYDEAEEHLLKINSLYPAEALSVIAKAQFKGIIKAYQNKDFTEVIDNMHDFINNDPDNALFHWNLGEAYNHIFNDDVLYLKYTRRAFELDSTKINCHWGYFKSLLENKNFEVASKMHYNVPTAKARYYLARDSLKKALESIESNDLSIATDLRLRAYAKMGERDRIDSIFNTESIFYFTKANVYALLRERDSMYYYLDKLEIKHNDVWEVNGNNDFNPYRNEERYKAFLRKHYMPTSPLNE